MKKVEIRDPLKYFFKKLERKYAELDREQAAEQQEHPTVSFDEVEQFLRALMGQNIFIYTVGLNGKPESTILAKAIYSMNKVVRIYYSTSMDDSKQGYIRLYPDYEAGVIVVERLHGYLPKPELLYASPRQCHIVRYLTAWLMRRINWDKTKLNNLDLYKQYVAEEKRMQEEIAAAAAAALEEEMLQKSLDEHFANAKRIVAQ